MYFGSEIRVQRLCNSLKRRELLISAKSNIDKEKSESWSQYYRSIVYRNGTQECPRCICIITFLKSFLYLSRKNINLFNFRRTLIQNLLQDFHQNCTIQYPKFTHVYSSILCNWVFKFYSKLWLNNFVQK